MAEWCGVENSARETKRRRGAHGGGRAKWGRGRKRGCDGGFSAVEERGRRAKGRRRALPGRNKLARNERQIASELSARSPDVIEAAMLLPPSPPLLLRLRVSLCLLPSARSLSPIFAYVRLILLLSFSPSIVPSHSFRLCPLRTPVPQG